MAGLPPADRSIHAAVDVYKRQIHLCAGDKLVNHNGEMVVVEQVQHEILEAPVVVYNFEVADYHTYFVGTNGVLVCLLYTSTQVKGSNL